jgi:hypothetical protein
VIENTVLTISRYIATPVYANPADPPRIELLFGPLENFLDLLFPIGALLAVGMLIYGGYMWIISGGDPSRKQVAQGTLTWALIGLVFLFLIRAILLFVLSFFAA